MRFKPGNFLKAHHASILLWAVMILFLILTQLGLAFGGTQQVQASASLATTSDPNTHSWTDPGGSGLTISFTTVQTYGSCVSTGDRIFTTGIPASWSLKGYVDLSYIQSDGSKVSFDHQIVNQNGDLDLTLSYPAAWTWTINTLASIREIHIDIAIEVFNGTDLVTWVGGDQANAPGTLGPGQNWDVFCRNTTEPQISFVKYTNGVDANDPNGADVPNIPVGGAITWTYRVTNTGNFPIARAFIEVTDNQPGVTPVFDQVITGNADDILDPGEVWQYKAVGTAVNLVNPPKDVIVTPGVCTYGGKQLPSTAYTNIGTVTIPGVTESDPSSYCNPLNPKVTIIKYTNGQVANDPNGANVPQIKPGDPVTWTYRVTNTGDISIPMADIHVTDNQPGVTPTFDSVITGNTDTVLDPTEVWQYKATGNAVNLSSPPPGVITVPNSCTLNQTQPARTAYVNQGTVTIPGDTDTAQSSYCNPLPGIAIVKFTNDQKANDPNGTDVPQIKPGDPVTWTYQVTNTGEVAIPKVDVVVTDNQPGVTPVFDSVVTGNADDVLDPGDVWLYKATGTAIDTTLAPQGVNIVHDACSYNNTLPQSPAYVNTGTVAIPGATANASSSYCNPLHYPYFGENGYIGIEDWINGDYDYNDFGFYFRIEETTTWACPGGACGPYLTHITVTTTAKIYDSGMEHLIHLHRVFAGGVHYTVTRTVPADPNVLTLFDGATGQETPAGNYISASGDVDVTLFNTSKYTHPQKLMDEPVVVDFSIDDPLQNPRITGTYVRSYTVGTTTFHDLDPIMSQYDFWEEGTLAQSRWHLKDTHPINDSSQERYTPASRIIPANTVVPFLIVVPYTNWIPPFENTTITGPYGAFRDFYTTGIPDDWYMPARVTDNCVMPGGVSFGPYPGISACNIFYLPLMMK